MSTITVCASVNFYRQVNEIQTDLEALGYKVIVPITATRMKKSGDYDVSHYKTWFADANDYHKKTLLVRKHFAEVKKGDAILIVNHEKHGVANYIGGNVLMEMALAFDLDKPIFILNDLPSESSFLEELICLQPVLLHGKLDTIKQTLH